MDWIQISKKIQDREQENVLQPVQEAEEQHQTAMATQGWWEASKIGRNFRGKLGIDHQTLQKYSFSYQDRNTRQVKEHYNNYLRPGITECDWNIEDDLLLINLLNC